MSTCSLLKDLKSQILQSVVTKNRVSLVGKRGVAGVMAEKLLSITAAVALPGGLNYEKHSTTLTCTTRSSRAGG